MRFNTRGSWPRRVVWSPCVPVVVLVCVTCCYLRCAAFLPLPRYFESVRQAVLWRVTRLSNDELSGEEEAVMSVVHSLMSLLEVIQPNSNVSMIIVHLVRSHCYPNRTLFFTIIL